MPTAFFVARQLIAVLLGLCSFAVPAADVSWSLGTGPGDFISSAIDSGFSVSSLRFDAGYYESESAGSRLKQTSGSARWNVTDKDSIGLGGRQIVDDVMMIKGATLSAALNLSRFWDGQYSTTLNFGRTHLTYSAESNRRLEAALVELFPDQKSTSVGVSQALPGELTLTTSYERYQYSRDPAFLARSIAVLFNRFRQAPPNQAYTLAGFPDKTWSGGLSWASSGKLTVDVSFSQTETVIDQRLRSASLGVTYSDGTLTLGSTITRSQTSEVLGPQGRVALIPGSIGTYVVIRAGAAF